MVKPVTLYEIVADYAPSSNTLQRVGLVGSYARGDAEEKSDVDLVFDTGGSLIDEAVLSAGMGIRWVLKNQFDTDTDIISYEAMVRKTNKPTIRQHSIETRGYELMLKDLKWIWRRE